jgi:hypothetical protein
MQKISVGVSAMEYIARKKALRVVARCRKPFSLYLRLLTETPDENLL